MSLINMLFLGIFLASLLMWLGNLVRGQGEDEKAGKYWVFFLLGGFGLSIVSIIAAWSISEYLFSMSVPVLLPITFGTTIALGLHLVQQKMTLKKTFPLFLIFLLLLSWITVSNNWIFLLIIAGMGIVTVLIWLNWGQRERQYLIIFAIEVILLGISIRVVDANRVSDMTPSWLGSIVSTVMYLFVPWAGIVLSALLLRRHLSNDHPFNWRVVISTLLMVAVLFLMIGYQAMLISMWDVATDGLGWVFLWLTTGIIGIGSAMLMAWSIPRKKIWAAILFALTVPSVLIAAQNIGTYDKDHTWGITPVITPERRADRIEKAIQNYYQKNNEYPQKLSDLTPRYILYLPNPYIIPGQNWCYEGGIDHYRFGYVYRQYFSTPASVRIHSSSGETFDVNWRCQDEADKYSAPLGF